MMKIAYITSIKRGLTSFTYREIEELLARGIEIVLFSLKFNKGLYMPKKEWEYYHFNPFIVVIAQPYYFLKDPLRYLKGAMEAIKTKSVVDFIIANHYLPIIRRTGVERIHCQEGLHAVMIGYYCSKALNIPLSVMVHADTLYVNPNHNFAKIALHACDAILTVSDYNRSMLIKNFDLPEKKVSVMRLGVRTDEFIPDTKKKVMIVGQFAARKGHETLFKAIKMLNRDDVELWVVGSGTWGRTDYVDVKELARQIGIYEKTYFFKNLSEKILKLLYQSCDIFCLPSRTSPDGNKEGIPVALMEAMALGKPVISTYHTGIPELVKEILIKENDSPALSSALSQLLDNKQLREKMGKMNRKIIEKEYSLPSNVNKLAGYFKQRKRI